MAAKPSGAKIQGIGFSDGTNILLYSFRDPYSDIETCASLSGRFLQWVWNIYHIPIADDCTLFDTLPVITSLVYVNDLDGVANRSLWIDSILDISDDVGAPPSVTVSHQVTWQRDSAAGARDVGVQFFSQVSDPDSDTFLYQWDFGDSLSSTEANPYHIYTVQDGHPYRATLRVTDSTGRWGIGSTLVNVDPGDDSAPENKLCGRYHARARRHELQR